jgi:hypothetical protein
MTAALHVASTVTVHTITGTGTPHPCERDCGSDRGVVRVHWQPLSEQIGLVYVCLACAPVAIGAALDDTPPDMVVTVELELYPPATGVAA